MESMLAEQQYLRSPIRPFSELDSQNNNLSLEEKALLAARSQLFLRAAGPFGPGAGLAGPACGSLGPVCALPQFYSRAGPAAAAPLHIPLQLWSQWACLSPSFLAQSHAQLAVAAAAAAASAGSSPQAEGLRLPRPVYPALSLSQHRYSPYCPSSGKRSTSPVSSPDSLRDGLNSEISSHSST